MAMVVPLSSGRDALREPAMMIFKNRNRNYPMKGVPDTIVGVAYITELER